MWARPHSHASRARESPERVRTVGVLIFGAEDDPVAKVRLDGLRKGLEKMDWVEGRNLRIDVRFGGADPDRLRTTPRSW